MRPRGDLKKELRTGLTRGFIAGTVVADVLWFLHGWALGVGGSYSEYRRYDSIESFLVKWAWCGGLSAAAGAYIRLLRYYW